MIDRQKLATVISWKKGVSTAPNVCPFRVDENDQIVRWDQSILGPPPNEVTLNSWEQDWLLAGGDSANDRVSANKFLDSPGAEQTAVRTIVVMSVEQFNAIRQWLMAFKAAVAESGTLAQLKIAVAALPQLPDITKGQARTVMMNKVLNGQAESLED